VTCGDAVVVEAFPAGLCCSAELSSRVFTWTKTADQILDKIKRQ
jgi:hypothetical protein